MTITFINRPLRYHKKSIRIEIRKIAQNFASKINEFGQQFFLYGGLESFEWLHTVENDDGRKFSIIFQNFGL